MPIEVGGVTLENVTNVAVRERARLVTHAVPGLAGDLTQALGRSSVEVDVHGIFYAESADDEEGLQARQDQLQQLRNLHLDQTPVDLFADAVGQAYFTQVLVTRLDVWQRAGAPNEFEYICGMQEYVEPPEPATLDLGAGLDLGILDEAAGFMDDIQNAAAQVASLVDAIASAPSFGDPTQGLNQMPNQYQSLVTGGGLDSLRALRDLF
jgi:hypothetical protein